MQVHIQPSYFKSKKRLWALSVFILAISAFVVTLLERPPQTPVLPKPPLKQLANNKGIDLGNFAILSRLQEKPYADILSNEFNLALIDNTPNWSFKDSGLRPSQNSFNFKDMDKVVDFAESHGMSMQAHHYLWGEEKWLPRWLKNGHYNKKQLLDLIHEHIQTVGSHYSGRIKEWTVVNEAFTRGQNVYGLHDWWADHLGGKDAYLDKAFIWARQADPHSKLILNDFNNEAINKVSDEMYQYVKSAKARGVPIDGIGMQMHIDGVHPPVKDEVIANMKRFGDLGVDVYVTEFDINMNDVQADDKTKNQLEANIYYEMMRACIESKVCHSFSILGITDKETWYRYMGLKDSRPLPFDEEYKPKPAFYALRNALEQ